jgi:hypothetical protein
MLYSITVVKEVLRWRPPIPAGLPHRLEQGKLQFYLLPITISTIENVVDDYYEGYFLPKDSTS